MEEPVRNVPKIRKCLNCLKDFKSKCAGHRICKICKQRLNDVRSLIITPVKDPT